MKRLFLTIALVLLAFALPAMAATSMPAATKLAYLQGDIQDAYVTYLVLYDAGTTACNNSTYDTYVNTNQTPAAESYALGAPTWATASTAARLDQLATLGVDDTHQFTSTGAIVTADCAVIYADSNNSSSLNAGDKAIYRSDVTEVSVGAGGQFTLTLTSGYVLSFD